MTVQWMSSQDHVVKTDVEEEPHLRNYALVAQGFPPSARSPHEVKAFFESILGFELEGVSIAYDHVEEADFVEDRIGKVLEKADTHLGVYPSELSSLKSHEGDSQDGYVLDCLMNSGYVFVIFLREEDRVFCTRRFEEIGRQVRSGLHMAQDDESDTEAEEKQALLLKTGPGKGRAASRPAPGGGPSRAVLFRGKFPIRVTQAPEPCGIQWRNFAVRRGAKIVRVAVTLLGSLLFVIVLGAVAFAPGVMYAMSYADIRKPSQAQLRLKILEQGVVNCSTAVTNRILVAVLRRAAELSGFLQKVNEDSVFLVCSFCAMLLNSAAPLIIAQVIMSAESCSIPRPLVVEWLFHTFWLCFITTEIAGVASPAWSYLSSFFTIRQSRYLSVREAEPLLTATEFPLATRYADMLHILSLVCAMIACDSTSLYTIGAQCLLLLYFQYVFFIDKYTYLRIHRQTYYTSAVLDSTAHYLFAFPLAILFVFPFQQVFVRSDGSSGLSNKFWWINIVIFVGNIVVFLVLVRICQKCNEPRRELSDIPYIEVASLVPYSYHNSNHVHVLRTLHFPSIVVPPIFPFSPGKEYLQGGQFADYDDSVRLRETLLLLAKSPLKGLEGFGNNS